VAIDGRQDWVARRRALNSELRRLPKPLAVFCYNDCIAADIIDACEDASLPVPEAVAVMGVDNDAMLCECISVPVSKGRRFITISAIQQQRISTSGFIVP
jgi:LacI family transcriptional regulator